IVFWIVAPITRGLNNRLANPKHEADSDNISEKTLNSTGVRPLRPRIPCSYHCATTGLRDYLQRRVVDRHLGRAESVKRMSPPFCTTEV
ncbi:hypothetical protein TSAR_009695, partial [Trichomalopsis sarcophagae]